jgi:hypothetical protein
MRALYELSQRLLARLNISNENIKYYASLVDYYTQITPMSNHWCCAGQWNLPGHFSEVLTY